MERTRTNIFKELYGLFTANIQIRGGTIILLIILAVMAITPLIATHDPWQISADVLAPIGAPGHLLGTDGLGRDLYSMLLYGARASIKIGLVSASISGVLGTIIGGFAGYYGGKVDQVISEIINIFLMVPAFFLILIVISIYGSNMTNVMLVIGLTTWPSNARLMRVQAMSLKERTFVRSAIAIGESRPSVFFRYIVPNGIYPVIANTTLSIAGAILYEASLSFLGLGDPNVVSWGQIIFQGKIFMSTAWWVSTLAGICTIILVAAFFLVGDGLNIALNPKLRNKG